MHEWEYSRNQRRHWVNDGESYRAKGDFYYLWEIHDCTPTEFVSQRNKEGYDLLHKGKKIKHGKTVKELKGIADGKKK